MYVNTVMTKGQSDLEHMLRRVSEEAICHLHILHYSTPTIIRIQQRNVTTMIAEYVL